MSAPRFLFHPIRFARRTPARILATLFLAQLAAQGEPPGDQQPPPEALTLHSSHEGNVLPSVVVVATRTAEDASQIAASAAVFDSNDPNNVFSLATSFRDYQRYEPGVTIPYSGGGNGPGRNSRAGSQGINIRGLEGNRVLMQVDGIRQADLWTFGGSTSVGRDLVDVDSLTRVEVLKNAASSLYGSDALAGVVSFRTKTPSDILGDDGNDWGLELTSRYDSADDSWGNTIAAALRTGTVEWLALYTRRDGNENDNVGSTPQDPADFSVDNFLGKVVWRPDDAHTFTLTGEYFQRRGETDVVSARRVVPLGFAGTFVVNSLILDDQVSRYRFSLSHEWDASRDDLFFDSLDWSIYYQESRTEERLTEDRDRVLPGPQDRLRTRDHLYVQDHLGWNLNLVSHFDTGSLHHQLAYGAEVITSFARRVRDATEFNFTTGTVSKVIFPDTFPLKDIPDTRSWRIGAYVQDQITWGPDERYRLTPGFRLEYFRLDETVDALYNNASAGLPPAGWEQFTIAPKLSFLANLDEDHQAWFQYSTGFRAPTPEDLNATLTNFILNYQTRANPDLQMETSHSFETGIRAQREHSSWSTALFYNYYQNFIETLAFIGGTGTPADPTVFQSVNLSAAHIYGLEFKGETDLHFVDEALADLVFFGNVSYLEGHDFQNNQPLNSIDPFKMVAGLRYERPTWHLGLISTFIARQNRTGSINGFQPFETGSAFTLDLVGAWQIRPNVQLTAGLYNLTNEQVLLFQDVRGFAANTPGIDRFTQPGINGRVALTLTF